MLSNLNRPFMNPEALPRVQTERFPKTLKQYVAWIERHAQNPSSTRLAHREYFKCLPLEGSEYILDVGSYVGANLIEYARRGHRIVGVECGETYYQECLKNLIEKLPTGECGLVRVVRSSIEEFAPGPDDELFDVVLCTELLGHVLDPVLVMQRCAEWLKPGGRIFLSHPIAKGHTWRRRVTDKRLKLWAEDAGLVALQGGTEYGQYIVIAQKPTEGE